jgi:hypothetical protein
VCLGWFGGGRIVSGGVGAGGGVCRLGLRMIRPRHEALAKQLIHRQQIWKDRLVYSDALGSSSTQSYGRTSTRWERTNVSKRRSSFGRRKRIDLAMGE